MSDVSSSLDPYDQVSAGDPSFPMHGQGSCGSRNQDRLICTRPEGHGGQHVAEGPVVIEAVWSGDAGNGAVWLAGGN